MDYEREVRAILDAHGSVVEEPRGIAVGPAGHRVAGVLVDLAHRRERLHVYEVLPRHISVGIVGHRRDGVRGDGDQARRLAELDEGN